MASIISACMSTSLTMSLLSYVPLWFTNAKSSSWGLVRIVGSLDLVGATPSPVGPLRGGEAPFVHRGLFSSPSAESLSLPLAPLTLTNPISPYHVGVVPQAWTTPRDDDNDDDESTVAYLDILQLVPFRALRVDCQHYLERLRHLLP